jgi:hypothetical protein
MQKLAACALYSFSSPSASSERPDARPPFVPTALARSLQGSNEPLEVFPPLEAISLYLSVSLQDFKVLKLWTPTCLL